MEDRELLEALVTAIGPTGNEKSVYEIIKKALDGFVDEIFVHQGSGSLIAFKRGNGVSSLLIEAHVDEVFMVVEDVLENGFLRFYSHSIDPKILPGLKVCVHGRKLLRGVIGVKPYHLVKPSEENKAYTFDELFVDCGMTGNKIREFVSVGDYITFEPGFVELQNYFVSKALDNRTGVFVLIEVLKALKRIKHEVNVYALFSTQEEFTSLGAITSSFSIFPDAALILDTTFAIQHKVGEEDGFECGKGPVIFVGASVSRKLTQRLTSTGERFGIPFSYEVGVLSSTDADRIQLVRTGIPTALVSIPIRYMHTPIEMVSESDLEKTVQLIKLFVEHYEPVTKVQNGEY